MKTEKEIYEQPQSELFSIKPEGIICDSNLEPIDDEGDITIDFPTQQ